MKTGLLVCDSVSEKLRPKHGDYVHMFQTFLPSMEFVAFNVCQGHFPDNPEACDAWMATGSSFSVYDRDNWIFQLKQFVKAIDGSDKPYVGVCFGHQMLAQALGGQVRKAESGWCTGVHEFEIVTRESWMEPYQPRLNLLAVCQDQVVELPEASQVLACSALCPVGMFRVGRKMLGIQGHPEFSKAYNQALMEARAEQIGEERFQQSMASLAHPIHNPVLAEWITRFLEETS